MQPDESHRREHQELAQLAKGDGHHQEGIGTVSAMPSARCPSLPPAYRHIVERKGERTESTQRTPSKGLPPQDPSFGSLVYSVIGSSGFQRQDQAACPPVLAPASSRGIDQVVQTARANRASHHSRSPLGRGSRTRRHGPRARADCPDPTAGRSRQSRALP